MLVSDLRRVIFNIALLVKKNIRMIDGSSDGRNQNQFNVGLILTRNV